MNKCINSYAAFLSFLPTIGDLIPPLVIACIFLWVFGLVTIIRYLKIREGNAQAGMEPLCSWRYTAAQWQKYAGVYDLAKFPKGAAIVRVTLLDVWIDDDGMLRRLILHDDRKCVTACRFENQILKIRVRSWACPTRFSSVVYSVQDFYLPVPSEMERDAIKAAKLFNENINRQNKKVVSVTPDNALNSFVTETDF